MKEIAGNKRKSPFNDIDEQIAQKAIMKEKMIENGMKVLFGVSAVFSIVAVCTICIFLFIKGLPPMAEIGIFKFLFGTEWYPSLDSFGILPMIVSSLFVTLGAMALGVPIGLMTAIFLAKYCPKKLYEPIKLMVNMLAGIPSIIYGFFGLTVIVPFIRDTFGGSGTSLMASCIVLAVMILPTIITLSEASIRAVPESYYEGALALGVSKERAVFRIVVPAAKSGITASIILGIGRAIGETMALVLVAGNASSVFPTSLLDPVRTLTSNIVLEMNYATGLHEGALLSTGVVLFVFILIINFLFSLLKKDGKRKDKDQKDTAKSEDIVLYQTQSESTESIENERNIEMPILNSRSLKGIRAKSHAIKSLVYGSGGLTVAILIALISYVLIKGLANLSPELFALEYTSENGSFVPALINTLILVVLTLAIALPIGVFSAIYLVEYAKQNNILVKLIRLTTETLAGIPSIVFGLFGYIMFVNTFKLSYSMLGGAITLALMVLPVIIRSTEESLLSVPMSFREGSYALGAGKLRTIFKIVLPSASNGIFVAITLAMGRIVGETAALIFTAGTNPDIIDGLSSSGRTLAVHVYALYQEGLQIDKAYGCMVVLIVLVLFLNTLTAIFQNRYKKEKK